jgi:C-terminal region of band_7
MRRQSSVGRKPLPRAWVRSRLQSLPMVAMQLPQCASQSRCGKPTHEASEACSSIDGLPRVHSQALNCPSGTNRHLIVVTMLSAQYLAAFGNIAKAGNTMLLPSSASDPATMVAQALSIYNNVSAKAPFPGGGCVLLQLL